MIVVILVDTSPSMGRPVQGGLSRLDLAKMAVEDLTRQWRRLRPPAVANLGHDTAMGDHFLLLSTSRQHPDTAACAAGGRLLVGFESLHNQRPDDYHLDHQIQAPFARALKSLQVAKVEDPSKPWQAENGGASGLNAALSMGLQLLSRYRLSSSITENFGMGRLPCTALSLSNGTSATAALQSACLIVLTDGACLRHPPNQGGGSLQIKFGPSPLREFYKDHFRWDQRVFVQAIGARPGVSSSQYLHPHLRELCGVTSGAHWSISNSCDIAKVNSSLLRRLCPPVPKELPLPDPLFQHLEGLTPSSSVATGIEASFVNSGPTIRLQAIDGTDSQATTRAMIFYVGSNATLLRHQDKTVLSPPMFCIPEAFFSSKKLDSLPPREAHPRLFYSVCPGTLGSKTFDAEQFAKLLQRYDKMIAANRKEACQPVKLLHRDVYVCNWIETEGDTNIEKTFQNAFFPLMVPGGGRQSLSEDGENLLNIGILHVPAQSTTLGKQLSPAQLATITLLPPDPHILLPLLMRVADAEHKVLKKSTLGGQKVPASVVVPLDESWRSEFRAYMFRVPPYYQLTLARCLRPLLPASAQTLLHTEGFETIAMQCFSKVCMQKIKNAEQISKETNERIERQEISLRLHRQGRDFSNDDGGKRTVKYGHFDPRGSIDNYLASLKSLPPPWCRNQDESPDSNAKRTNEQTNASPKSVLDVVGDLPASCTLGFYESRRRWIFGGSGETIKGLHVGGVRHEGSNSQRFGKGLDEVEECPLSISGIGASSTNQTSIAKMGEYRERLLFSRSPVVGFGANDYAGVSATTGIDGSPVWSVDDDAMPASFFDDTTGYFVDTMQARVRAKLVVNFGNPYKEKRGDSLIPEKFVSQTPSKRGGFDSPKSPRSSPPQVESDEEGEAIFQEAARKSPSTTSPSRTSPSRLSSSAETVEKAPAPPKHPPPPPPPATPPPKRSSTTEVSLEAVLPPTSDGSGGTVQTQETPVKANLLKPPPPKPKVPPPAVPKSLKATPPPPKNTPPPPKSKPKPPPPKPPSLDKMSIESAAATLEIPQPQRIERSMSNESVTSASSSTSDMIPMIQETKRRLTTTGQAKPASGEAGKNDLDNPDQKPEVALPPGWMTVWSKSQKRWYFFDTKANKSVWQWPP